MELDNIDRKILEKLQSDGRTSNVELAEAVHLSAPQTLRRVRALEERGVIKGYRALVNAGSLGLGVTAFVAVNIEGEAFKRVREIERLMCSYDQVLECHTVSGEYDYLLKVVARDLKHLSNLLTDRLMQIAGVANVRSMICLEEMKSTSELPIE